MKHITLIFDGERLIHDICVVPSRPTYFKSWEIRLWNLSEGRKVATLPGEQLIGVTSDGQGMLTRFGYEDHQFHAYETHTGAAIERSALANAPFRFNQRYELRPHSKDKTLKILDGLGVDTPREIPFERMEDLHVLEISPDGGRFVAMHMFDVAGFEGGGGSCYDITGKELFKFHQINYFASPPLVVFAEHHPLLSIEATQGEMTIYDVLKRQPTHRLGFNPRAGRFLAFSPQMLIAYHNRPKTWCLIDGTTSKEIDEPDRITAGAFSQDGERLAVMLIDGRIRIYGIRNLALEMEFAQD